MNDIALLQGHGRSSVNNAPDQALLHHRSRRGKRPLYHSQSSPALISDDNIPPPNDSVVLPMSPLSIQHANNPLSHQVVLEEIPEDCVESDV